MLQFKLEFKQTQSLVITPQLQQAIKLLQLSNIELSNYLQQEIEKNPLIDWDENGGSEKPASDSPGGDQLTASTAEGTGGSTPDWKTDSEKPSAGVDENPDDAAQGEPGAFESFSLRSHGTGGSEGAGSGFEDWTAEKFILRDHLRQQMQITIADPQQRLVADHIIDLIDDAGYLQGTLEEICERLSAPESLVEGVLNIIHTFEPAGIGARSLAECLALQLKDRNRYDPAMAALLDNLDLLARRDFAALQRHCKVDLEDLTEMVAEIQALNPRPGQLYGFHPVDIVVPDILVERNRSGELHVRLNDDTMPRIRVNRDYFSSVKRSVRSEKDRSYLKNCMMTANWLARSLDQRRQTMLKVSREIVKQQEAFFRLGVRGLKPLALKDVAEHIGMHESTVSRVTSNKYMQTPRGTFELKYFFSSAIASACAGDAHSSEAVKDRIRELVDNETADKVLSDDKIVSILKDNGIDIARRTVAKYRELMNIPSSVQRRRNKLSPERALLSVGKQ